jgi:hypothetical protein
MLALLRENATRRVFDFVITAPEPAGGLLKAVATIPGRSSQGKNNHRWTGFTQIGRNTDSKPRCLSASRTRRKILSFLSASILFICG